MREAISQQQRRKARKKENTVKEYLSRAMELNERICELAEEIEALKHNAIECLKSYSMTSDTLSSFSVFLSELRCFLPDEIEAPENAECFDMALWLLYYFYNGTTPEELAGLYNNDIIELTKVYYSGIGLLSKE